MCCHKPRASLPGCHWTKFGVPNCAAAACCLPILWLPAPSPDNRTAESVSASGEICRAEGNSKHKQATTMNARPGEERSSLRGSQLQAVDFSIDLPLLTFSEAKHTSLLCDCRRTIRQRFAGAQARYAHKGKLAARAARSSAKLYVN